MIDIYHQIGTQPSTKMTLITTTLTKALTCLYEQLFFSKQLCTLLSDQHPTIAAYLIKLDNVYNARKELDRLIEYEICMEGGNRTNPLLIEKCFLNVVDRHHPSVLQFFPPTFYSDLKSKWKGQIY